MKSVDKTSSFKSSILLLTMVACLFFVTSMAKAIEVDKKHLLLIYSYHPTFATTNQVYQGLLSGLDGAPVEIDIEYMDSKSWYDDTSINNFYRSLSYKLKNRQQYDYIVTSDDNALDFALTYRKQLFPDTPIVFLGVNNIEFAMAQNSDPAVSGVIEATSIPANIEIIKSIFPDKTDIYVIGDGTTTGNIDIDKWSVLVDDYPSIHWHLLDLEELSWDEFKQALKSIDPDSSSLLLLSAYRDKNNVNVTFDESLNLIVSNTDTAIFHPYQHGIGEGILGGVVVDHEQQGIKAGKIVVQHMLGGAKVNIPVIEASHNLPIFDARQLQRYKVESSNLPEGSVVKFEEASVFERYTTEIIGVLLVLVVLLLLHGFARYQTNKHTKASEKKLRIILDSIDAFIYLKDLSGKYLFANKLTREQFGLSFDEMLGKTDYDLFDNNMAKKIEQVDQRVIKYKYKYSQNESFWREESQSLQEVITTKTVLLDENSNAYALCGVTVDITAQKRHERLLEQSAFYDTLTGVPNRLVFIERLTQAMCKSDRSNRTLFVVFFDIDNFSQINKKHGHDFGDTVLKAVINRAKKVINKDSVIARLGGDEFYLLFESESNSQHEPKRVLESISEPIDIDNHQIVLTACAGLTSYPQSNSIEPEHLMRQSEQALYIAKSYGANQIRHFNGYEPNIENSSQFNELLRAFSSNEFMLYFQPKVSLIDGSIVGLEALIRWNHPDKGVMTPDLFLPDVERYNLIKTLDDWVIDRALLQVNTWFEEGLTIPVSINVSHAYFRQKNIAELLKEKLYQYPNLPSSLIEIEIVETNALDNLTEVADTIRSCKELGICFALDDFGTGYSSLTYLQQLPVNSLKVDRSFVINMLTSKTDLSILQGILGFCRAFDMTSVAEGVETIEHGRRLKIMGYQVAQGYGIARPMPSDQVHQWANNWVSPREWEEVQ
ncbi:ABC transporter substrate binding protein [Vibrio sp. TH_r3]|uniref:ABC transporter substrate binding protein n=1 Tax=Vibrio sp. TH_r3 TaxID=3082084 RepID=UPI002952ECA3|nr:ABC transporter substrate binding protein [Vibrio sp. TH_r3]MDV7104958.1 ABC transporter substrate binding protein [Vibrio sp. TH_r3]